MALILDSRFMARTNAGAPVSGAKLYVYDAGTTDLADVYTTSALSTPLANPVVADSNGRFAQIFAPEGQVFDLVLKTSGDVVIATYDDVPSLGPETASFTRDFGTGGRVAIVGAAGAISLRAGPQSPDDTGGDLTLEGQDGTQLDRLELDSALTEITGKFYTKGQSYLDFGPGIGPPRFNGGQFHAGVVVTAAGAFSAAGNVDIPIPADYDVVDIDIVDLVGAISSLSLRASFDAGSTFKSSSGDYAGINSAGTTADTSVPLGSYNAATGLRAQLKLRVVASGASNIAQAFMWQLGAPYGGTAGVSAVGSAHTKNSYGRITHVRIFPNTSTITGRYRVVGQGGF